MMVMRTLIRQTAFLSASHFVVRLAGFILRIWLSRELGAQAMGLVELTGSMQMLLVTPVVSGLPAAVSRMCAKAEPAKRIRIVRTGMALALGAGLPIALLAFMLRAPLAQWLGDVRVLPALLCYLPCIPVLGVSCVLNGYYYGSGRPVPPALSEMLEQFIRLLLCVRLVLLLKSWPPSLLAAIPGAAALAGETAGLFLMLILSCRVLLFDKGTGSRRAILSELLSLALPLTGMKLVTSLMRTVNTALIPARLQVSGLSSAESLAQLGMMNGMMMPILMIPSFITCSLCMVASPELTRRQAQGKPLRTLSTKILGTSFLIGLTAMAGVFLFAPVIAGTLYRKPDLLPLLRRSCLLVPVMALVQVCGGMMNGLGLQGTSLRIAVSANLLSVCLAYVLAAQPGLRLWGAVIAMACGQLLTLALSLRALRRAASG